MDLAQARCLKEQLLGFARELADRYGAVTAYDVVVPGGAGLDGGARDVAASDSAAVRRASLDAVRAPTLSLGLTPAPGDAAPVDAAPGVRASGADGAYAVAVRYRLGVPAARAVVRRIAAEAGADVDVRRTGRIRTLGPRPPVASARALGETGRARPLRPGVSIANAAVTAGTLGGFVVDAADGAPVRYALSNWHVLAGSPQAAAGDVVVQPGPADGGAAPRDRVGALARWAPLAPGEHHRVDAALALLDDGVEVDATYPQVGRVSVTAPARGGERVAKVGRTTSLTHGRVSAIELDDVLVGYGDELGVLGFDGQIEVESTGGGPFSRGGDSGSLVFREDGAALGLLFAGSETGGPDGSGLTYLNPIDAVLDALGVTLM
ncbi:hypothetical protein GCM10007967_16480 [Xylanimonas ulmi]